MNGIAINPVGVLAAVLYMADVIERKKQKLNDSMEEVTIDFPQVRIGKEGLNLMCAIPFKHVEFFQQQMRLDMGLSLVDDPEGNSDGGKTLVITFQPANVGPSLLNANGEKVKTTNPALDALKMRLGL